MMKLKEKQEIIFQGKDFYIISGLNQDNRKYFEAWQLENGTYYKKFEATNYFERKGLEQLLKKSGDYRTIIEKTIVAQKDKYACLDIGQDIVRMRDGKIFFYMIISKEDIFRKEKGLENNINDAGTQSNN